MWSKILTPMPYFIPPLGLAFFIQALPAPIGGDWPALGVGGGIAMVMFYLYREDRKASEKRLEDAALAHAKRLEELKEQSEKRIQSMKEASEGRLTELTKNFMFIVQENTRALTTLVDQSQRNDESRQIRLESK